ncbi:MAG: NUDIX domain-containing protein [Vicingaceae bacterium]
MFDETKNPWKTLNSEVKYDNPWIKITEHKTINAADGDGIYGVVHFKNIAIGIIPLDENYNTWLVGQYRYPLNQYSWEICEGGGIKNENVLTSAKRELLEELGIKASSWEKIMDMHLSNSVSDEEGVIYVAKDLSFFNADPEDCEVLQIKKVPLSTAYEMVMSGKITDSLTVAGVLKAKILVDKGVL